MTRRLSLAVARTATLLSVCAWLAEARAEVLFQNTGNTMGWGRVFTQKAGTITEVSTPVYKGTTAVKTTQTYQRSDGANYHSEIIKEKAHLAGQDLYYGHAVFLPADWVFHGQNVTFQQWAPEDPEGPWILMYLQGDMVRLGGRGAMGDKDVGRITGLRGTWIRVITRIHMANPGTFEVWINDQKFFSQRGNFRAVGPSMRWSNGIYCTRWDTETPTGPRELTFFHDNMRIATTYEEADPAKWGDGDPVPAPDAGTAGVADASPPPPAADAGAPAPDVGGAAGAGGSAGGAGGASGNGAGGGTQRDAAPPMGGTGGSDEPGSGGTGGEEPPSRAASSGGCQIHRGAAGPGWALLIAGLWLIARWRRRRA